MAPHCFRLLSFALTLFAAAPLARAQLVFTIEAKATADGALSYGYDAGATYNLVIAVNRDYSAGNPSSSAEFNWWEPTDKSLYESVGGNMFTGVYVPILASHGLPCSLSTKVGGNMLDLVPSNFNLTPPNPDYNIGLFEVVCYLHGVTFGAAAPTNDPQSYFSSSLTHSGDQPLDSGGFIISDDIILFEITSLSVTGFSPVPEPATYAALIGAAALGFVAWRRRRAA